MNVTNPTQSESSSVAGVKSSVLIPREVLLDLLVSIRGSDIETEKKTVIRDLVLEYAKSEEGDETEAKEIIKLLEKYPDKFSNILKRINVRSAPLSIKVGSKAPASFGGARVVPKFGTRGSSTETPVPTTPTESPKTETVPEDLPTKQPEAEPQAEAVTPPTPEPETAPVQTPTPPPTATYDSDEKAFHRIREIKHHINEMAGNPVNLVEKNNEVGREYMAALLDAMKKTTGGIGGVDAAMKRLETAYDAAVMVLSGSGEVKEDKKELSPIPEPKVESKSEPESEPEPTSVPEPKTLEPEIPKPEPVAPPVDSSKEESPVNEPPRYIVEEESAPAPAPEVETQSEPEPVPTKVVPEKEESTIPLRKVNVASMLDDKPQDITAAQSKAAPAPEPEPAKQPHSLHSLAAAAKLGGDKKTESVPSSSDDTKAVPKTPTPSDKKTAVPKVKDDVQKGLEQLLSEWKLFKSSGFLGMGPSGKDHPLYKKLANLSMASIISGRFEGATPEVQQSIMDYIKGWRYEQNVTHELNETFEHYLTRVIQRIIEKSKTK